jgi:hypothetical protein
VDDYNFMGMDAVSRNHVVELAHLATSVECFLNKNNSNIGQLIYKLKMKRLFCYLFKINSITAKVTLTFLVDYCKVESSYKPCHTAQSIHKRNKLNAILVLNTNVVILQIIVQPKMCIYLLKATLSNLREGLHED